MPETSHNGYTITFLHRINYKCSNGDPGSNRSHGSSSNVACLSFCCQTLSDASRSNGAVPTVLWPLFVTSNISLSFGHLSFSLMKQKINVSLSVKFLCFLFERGFDCTKKCLVNNNFDLFCITVISRVLPVVQEGRYLCLGSSEVSSKKGRTRAIKKEIEIERKVYFN
jgi:hypothetical protein